MKIILLYVISSATRNLYFFASMKKYLSYRGDDMLAESSFFDFI
ncbi:MAG: hypothetical protein RLN88_07610 [Ekhidna sp.]